MFWFALGPGNLTAIFLSSFTPWYIPKKPVYMCIWSAESPVENVHGSSVSTKSQKPTQHAWMNLRNRTLRDENMK